MRLREMTSGDIDAGLRLCRLSRWNQVARDWERFLDDRRNGAHVAVTGQGQVVGSVATIRYTAAPATPAAPTLAWLAMVLVDPEARGRGIGTSLLEHGLASVADVTTLGLDATALGRPLYEKLGFRMEETLTRLERAAGPPEGAACGVPPDAAAVRPMAGQDLALVARLDARATGLDRGAMLRWLWEGAPQFAWVAGGPSDVAGFVLGRRGHTFHHLGPIVATSLDAAIQLMRTCVQHHRGTPLIVDIADAQRGLHAAVEGLGFTAQRPFARMYRGDWRPHADRRLVFAAIGPEFG